MIRCKPHQIAFVLGINPWSQKIALSGQTCSLVLRYPSLYKFCNVSFFQITDWPDIQYRGLTIDISDGRILRLEHLMYLVNIVTFLKYNQVSTQQNSYSISYLQDRETTWWLNSDIVVTVVNCWQQGDYTAIGTSVTMLPEFINSDYTINVTM